jgi:hypothetical protein
MIKEMIQVKKTDQANQAGNGIQTFDLQEIQSPVDLED